MRISTPRWWGAAAILLAALALAGCSASSIAQGFVRQHTQCIPAVYWHIRWSPDGKSIAYAFRDASASATWPKSIHIMDVATGSDNEVYHDDNGVGGLTWSPDGMKLAFSANRETDLYIFDISTRQATRIITGGTHRYFDPDWSPDGRKLVLSTDEPGFPEIRLIKISDIPAANAGEALVASTRIWALGDNKAQGEGPRWSPDGRLIAVVVGAEGQLLAISFDEATGVFVLPGRVDADISWSHDGKLLLFSRSSHSSVTSVYDIASGEERLLLSDAYSADWSPDDKQIAYMGEDNAAISQVYVMDASGGNVRQLTHNSAHNICLH